MEPFRRQYTPHDQSSRYSYTPDSQPTNFTFSPDQYSTTFPLKPVPSVYTSAIQSPLYAPRNSIARGRWKWRVRKLSSKFWLWEVSACLFSLGIAGLIYYHLNKLDKNPVWHWDYRIGPTSTLAFAVTVLKAAMMIPVASALGQLKWHWFRTPRDLDGMEHFDEASRGVLGSIGLLWRLKLWRLASIGALITICALSLDALTQNAVQISHRVPTGTSSYIFATNKYDAISTFGQDNRNFPPSWMLSVVFFALTTTTNITALEQDLFYCSTGNCDYGSYQTLGVDGRCKSAPTEGNGRVVRHPSSTDDEFALYTKENIINSTVHFDYPTSPEFSDIGPLIFRWLALVNPSTVDPDPIAIECAFWWAVGTFESKVVNGTLNETITKVVTNSTDHDTKWHNIIINEEDCGPKKLRNNNTEEDCTYTVSGGAHAAIQSFLSLGSYGFVGFMSNETTSQNTTDVWNYNNIFMMDLASYVIRQNHTKILEVLSHKALLFSWALTTAVRQAPVLVRPRPEPYIYAQQYGTTLYPAETYYQIKWEYLVFPAVLVGLSALFFIATVIFTWKEGVWKSSQLAVLFHGLSDHDTKAVRNIEEYADMRDIGRGMQVRLIGTKSGKKLASRDAMLET